MATELDLGLPLTTLDRAITILVALERKGRPLSKNELAAVMGLSAGTGSLNDRTIAAKRFGLATADAAGVYRSTELGQRLASEPHDPASRMQALMSVEGFRVLNARFGDDPAGVSRGDLAKALEEHGVDPERAWRAAYALRTSWLADGHRPAVKRAATMAVGQQAVSAPIASVPDAPVLLDLQAPAVPAPQVARSRDKNLATSPVIAAMLSAASFDDVRWTPAERDAWLEMFASAIRFLRPAREEGRHGSMPSEGHHFLSDRSAWRMAVCRSGVLPSTL